MGTKVEVSAGISAMGLFDTGDGKKISVEISHGSAKLIVQRNQFGSAVLSDMVVMTLDYADFEELLRMFNGVNYAFNNNSMVSRGSGDA